MGARGAGAGDTHGVAAPAGWYDDPGTRHEARFWSGGTWSEHVTDAGLPAVDPVVTTWPAPPPTAPGTGEASGGVDTTASVVSTSDARVIGTRQWRFRSPATTSTTRGRTRLAAGALAAVGIAVALLVSVGSFDAPSGSGRTLRRAAFRDAGSGRATTTAGPDGGCGSRGAADPQLLSARGCTERPGAVPATTTPGDDAPRRADDRVTSQSTGTTPTSDPVPTANPTTPASTATPTTTSPAEPTTTTTTTPALAPPPDPVSDPSRGGPSDRPACAPGYGGGTPTGCG